MVNISPVWNGNTDWYFADGNLSHGDDLISAILLSKPQSFSAAGQQYAAVWDTRANHPSNIALNVLLP